MIKHVSVQKMRTRKRSGDCDVIVNILEGGYVCRDGFLFVDSSRVIHVKMQLLLRVHVINILFSYLFPIETVSSMFMRIPLLHIQNVMPF